MADDTNPFGKKPDTPFGKKNENPFGKKPQSSFVKPEPSPAQRFQSAASKPRELGWGETLASDVLKSFGTGIEKGIAGLPGQPGDIAQMQGGLSHWLASQIPGISPAMRAGIEPGLLAGFNPLAPAMAKYLPKSQDLIEGAERLGMPVHAPQTAMGRYAESIGGAVPYFAFGPQSAARKGLQSVGAGLGSEFLGDQFKGTWAEQPARIMGGIFGGGLGTGLKNVRKGEFLGRDVAEGGVQGRPFGEGPSGLTGAVDRMLIDRQGRPYMETPVERAEKLSDMLHQTATGSSADIMELRKQAAEAVKATPHIQSVSTPREWMKPSELQERLYAYGEHDPSITLSPEEQAYWSKYIMPLKQEEAELYGWLKGHGAPDDISTDGYMHRMVRGKEQARAREEGGETFENPLPKNIFSGSGRLSTSTPSLQNRTFFSVEKPSNKPGAPPVRWLVSRADDGSLQVWRNGKPTGKAPFLTFYKKGETPRIGEELGDGWTVDHARTSEIEKNTPYRYNKNAFANTADNVQRLRAAKRNLETLAEIKSSDWFMRNAGTIGGNTKIPPQWITTKNPHFRGWAMEPRLAHALDDFARGPQDYASWERGLAAANRFMVGSLFWSPVPHALNVAGHAIVSRGWDNFTPQGVTRSTRMLGPAIREVVNGGPKYREFLREGGALIAGGLDNQQFYSKMLKKFGTMMEREPSKWDPIVKAAGFTGVPQAVKALYGWSRQSLWTMGDILMMQRYMEEMAKGKSPQAAIKEVEAHIPNYRIPDQVMGTRGMSEFLQNPAFGQFNRYHYGVMKSWGNVVRDVVGAGREGTTAEQMKAAGQLFATMMLATAITAGVDQSLKYVSGDKSAHAVAFGPLGPLKMFGAMGPDNDADLTSVINGSFSLAPMTKSIIEAWTNIDMFTGKHIRTQTADQTTLQRMTQQSAQLLDHLAQIGFSPYQTATGAWKDAQTGADVPKELAKAFMQQGLHFRLPSPRQEVGKIKGKRAQRFENRTRIKRPRGPIEQWGERASRVFMRKQIKPFIGPNGYGGPD